MVALPSVPKTLRIDLLQTIGADVFCRNHMYFQYTGSNPAVADLNTLAATVSTAWNTNLAPDLSNVTTLTAVEITDLNSASGAQTVFATSHAGTQSTTTLPASICAVVRFRIARRYRGGHPRMYLGGLTVTPLLNADQFTTSFVSTLASNFSSFVTAIETSPPAALATLTHVSVSYFAGFTVSAPAGKRAKNIPIVRGTPLVDTVIGYSVNPKFASQRRRVQQSP